MEKNQIFVIIGISLVVAVIASIATASITGNVIRVRNDILRMYPEVYTKAEVDALTKNSCQYVNYKDGFGGGSEVINKSISFICQNYFGQVPKIIVATEEKTLYNKKDCSPSYQIFSSVSDKLLSYKPGLSGVILGETILQKCSNALFADESSNENYSQETFQYYSGVICCPGIEQASSGGGGGSVVGGGTAPSSGGSGGSGGGSGSWTEKKSGS